MATTANYVLINEQTLNASASSVTFSSIPQTGYTDLVVKMSTRANNSGTDSPIVVTFNGSTTGYTDRAVYGTGSAAGSVGTGTGAGIYWNYSDGNTATSNTFGNGEMYIPNYTSSNYKSLSIDTVSENNATAAFTMLTAGLWSNTAAITSITFTPNASALLMAGSTFSLYGVAAVGTTPTVVPKASGGSIIKNDGTYWYHAFLSSGTFTPNSTLSADVLVVAGGGSGGTAAGGGGSGGVLAFASQSLTATSYTCTVGAGGAALSTYANSNNGSNSQFASLTASIGGGGGGGYNNSAYVSGNSGGSGGGSAWGIGNTYGTGTSGQGNNGGLGAQDAAGGVARNGGGGGGAGAAGGNGSIGTPPAGGVGVNTVTNWGALSAVFSATGLGASGYIAGGGGGTDAFGGTGAGGTGGGGAGNTSSPVSGTVNTGGGGGGGSNTSGAGGSGIIIVRYLM